MSDAEDWTAALVSALQGVGVPDDEVDAAHRAGPGALLALFADHVFIQGTERLTRGEVAERAGIPLSEASAFWRALGFADVSDEDRIFTGADVEVLKRVALLLQTGVISRELALQMTRVMGRAAAQVAAAQIDIVRRAIDPERLEQLPAVLAGAPTLIEDVERWLTYVFRRHFVAEVKRVALQLEAGEAGTAIVGFADLVGFTGISQQLDEESLASAVSGFEAKAVEIVGAHSGRVIKMIGDEVMFEASTARDGATIALDLVEEFTMDDALPDARGGVAAGPAIRNQGDLFGTAPNLASRLVDAAYPGTVLVSHTIHEVLDGEPDLVFKPVRPQHLKGFGRTRFWKVLREGQVETRRPWQIPVLDDLLESASQALQRREDE